MEPGCHYIREGRGDDSTGADKKLCIENPMVLCSDGSISPTKALKGSMEIFIEASIIHSIPAAIQRTGEFGIISKASEARIAPDKK